MNREERLKFRRQNQALFASKENGQHQPPGLPPPVVPQKAPRIAQKPPEQRKAVYQRLPVGSFKRLVWDGSVWVGTLSVPDAPAFHFEAASEAKCFHGLHNEYTNWLKEQEAQK